MSKSNASYMNELEECYATIDDLAKTIKNLLNGNEYGVIKSKIEAQEVLDKYEL